MKIIVQEFLKNHSFNDLATNHGVYPSFSNCQSYFSLNYNQYESKENDLLASQCRGLILSFNKELYISDFMNIIPGDTEVLAFPFCRFFNYSQDCCAQIDWNNSTVYSKEDGTCIILWFNKIKNEWCVATRSVPDADIILNPYLNLTFSQLFKVVLHQTYNIKFEYFVKNLDKNITYIFELCSIYNKVVVDYPTPKIFAIGARDLRTFKEINIESINLPVDKIKSFNLSSLNDCVNWVLSQNGLEQEGVVVKDLNFNRIKIKNPDYSFTNSIVDILSKSPKRCIEIILLNKYDDLKSKIPEHISNIIDMINNQLNNYIHFQNNSYNHCIEFLNKNQTNSKKEFANLILQNKKYNHAYFFMKYDKKINSFSDFVDLQTENNSVSDSFLCSLLKQLGEM